MITFHGSICTLTSGSCIQIRNRIKLAYQTVDGQLPNPEVKLLADHDMERYIKELEDRLPQLKPSRIHQRSVTNPAARTPPAGVATCCAAHYSPQGLAH